MNRTTRSPRHDTLLRGRRSRWTRPLLPALLLAALATGCTPPHQAATAADAPAEPVEFLLGVEPIEPGPVTIGQAGADENLFILCLERRADLDLAGRRIRLRFRGEETPFVERHRLEGTGAWHDCASIRDRERAEALARALGVPVARRVSRPCVIRTTFECERAELGAGEDVLVRMRLENEGPSPLRFDRAIPGAAGRMPCFWVAVKRDGEPVSRRAREGGMVGLTRTQVLVPGDDLRETLNLSDRFPTDRPGTYEARIVHTLEVVGPPWPFDVAQHCPHLVGDRVERQAGTVRFVVR